MKGRGPPGTIPCLPLHPFRCVVLSPMPQNWVTGPHAKVYFNTTESGPIPRLDPLIVTEEEPNS